ncbi:MAG: hypothetical protein IPM24_28020 [Bryobacterales bacterium]|nr:hypothetical protein [Bryobacterales bacterium]
MGGPALSVVLATDTFATIQGVIECLGRQTLRHAIEIVVVSPDRCPPDLTDVRHVPHPVNDLADARAAGVRAAAAPLVFIGETHSFPDPDLAERTVAAFSDPQWFVVVPALRNANPTGVLSWSGFLCDYGAWAEELPEGPLAGIPVYNATFRRKMLLALGDRLPAALAQSDDLAVAMRASGQRALFLPSTCVSHQNTTQFWPWVRNRFLGGQIIAANRSRTWPWPKRLVFACGAFLVPAVLLPRFLPGWRARVRRGPAGTMAAVLLSLCLRAAGETLGYAGLFVAVAEKGILDLELHKMHYSR